MSIGFIVFVTALHIYGKVSLRFLLRSARRDNAIMERDSMTHVSFQTLFHSPCHRSVERKMPELAEVRGKWIGHV